MTTDHPISWHRGGESFDLRVAVHEPSTSLAELVAALAAATGGQATEAPVLLVSVDGVAHPAAAAASEVLRRGARVAVEPASSWSSMSAGGHPPAIVAADGLEAGRTWALGPGRHVVGRGPDAAVDLRSLTVSRRHAIVEVGVDGSLSVVDLGSRNGTELEGRRVSGPDPVPWPLLAVTRLGRVGLVPMPARGPARAAGALHRRPRERDRRPDPSIHQPAAPPPEPSPPRFSWAGAVVPLGLAVVLALVIDPRLVWFGLTGPVMVTASWWEERRRARRARRESGLRAEHDDARRAADLAAARVADRAWLQRIRPDMATVVGRALDRSPLLWERRTDHDDFLVLRVGAGAVPWSVRGMPADGDLADAPVALALGPGRVVGVVGDPEAARSLARALLVQVTVHHGPADCPVVTLTDQPSVWDWTKWLPHTVGPDGRQLRASDLGAAADGGPRSDRPDARFDAIAIAPARDGDLGIFGSPAARPPRGPVPVLVVDRSGPRPPLGEHLTAVIVARSLDVLPSTCAVVVDVDREGRARLLEPATGLALDDVTVSGLARSAATDAARALAPLTDPEQHQFGGGLPPRITLADALGLREPDGDAIAARWRANRLARPVATIGVARHGPLEIDLDADGPHALVAGTTGAGKSELLRTLVASLAAGSAPEHLTFVLVDFKGGSAFDACARLPHVAGVVTDLDEHLAARALRCLEAELRDRERRLREAGVADIATFHRRYADAGRDRVDLARLVVVIDEFATLVGELPSFVESLVDVAQRGRSLGVHLVLATQRPSGVVSPVIRANTNVRIALRVQDAVDSTEVIDLADAAAIPRRCPGRGLVRLGPGELVAFQTALSTASRRDRGQRLTVRPFTLADEDAAADAVASTAHATELDALVEAARQAAVLTRSAPVRRPWTDPLPDRIALGDPGGLSDPDGGEPGMGLLDDPDHQCRRPLGWDPSTGHLAVFGTVGAGTTTTLHTVAVSLARARTPADLHLYAIDFDAGGLSGLAALSHMGAVIGPHERERLERLVGRLGDQLERRRAGAPCSPTVVVLVDNLPGLLASVGDVRSVPVQEALRRLVADGPSLGMTVVATADGPHGLPLSMLANIPNRWVLRRADPGEALALGLRISPRRTWPAGRGFEATSGLELQVADPAEVDLAAVGHASDEANAARPSPVGVLPDLVPVHRVTGAADLAGAEWFVPVGIGGSSLGPAGFRLGGGDHVLVTGPSRSGKSTVLQVVARSVAAADPAVERIAVCSRPSPLLTDDAVTRSVDPVGLGDLAAQLLDSPRPAVLLVDDAEALDDPSGALSRLVRARPGHVHVIASAAADRILAEYGHWTRELRRSRIGLALRPLPDRDGEVWHTTFPRHAASPMGPGRGYLVHHDGVELVQVATPPARHRHPAPEVGVTQDDLPGYELVALVGRSASTMVWRARDPVSGREVAIKRRHRADAVGARQLREEATLLAAVAHPGVIALEAVIPDGDGVALVMEWAAGAGLRERIAAGPLPVAEVVAVMAAVADALVAVHRRGVLHLDVKPANILFDGAGRPKLADFSAALRVSDNLDDAPSVAVTGTAEYLDPALLAGARPDERSDVYGLGVTCWEALTGRPPYEGSDPAAVITAALAGDHDPLEELAPVSAALAAVVTRAMARRADDRFADAAAFAASLRAAASEPSPTRGYPVGVAGAGGGAPPPRPELRASPPSPARRRRTLVALGGAAAVLIAAAAILFVTMGGERDSSAAPADPTTASTRARRTAATDATSPECPTPGPHPDSGAVLVEGDPDIHGCARIRVEWSDGLAIVTRNGGAPVRYRLGRPGDQLLLGDWDCDRELEPILYRPSTGSLYRFHDWPEVGTRGTSDPAIPLIPGGVARAVDADHNGCHDVVVQR